MRLMHYPIGHITGWRLFFNDPLMVHTFIHQIFPVGIKWKDWREQKGELFQAIHL